MKNINHIKHFKNIENISNIKKRRLAFKKRNDERLLKNRGYRDLIAKVKSKKSSDDAILENLELSYLKHLKG
ncbi:hypothetical protein [Helicobacter pylori]|uniref:hypothetical protein n=1 Tax=Helicobacter pylori TaxID=210 RepID=UPI000575DF96|nr:hypothetical protein [Helicobacter pylori]ANT42547.1 hypothetical protein [Helicobacter phage Pt22899G]KHL87312.1 hypothetical protein HPY228_02155 [Helicobacter pylori]